MTEKGGNPNDEYEKTKLFMKQKITVSTNEMQFMISPKVLLAVHC